MHELMRTRSAFRRLFLLFFAAAGVLIIAFFVVSYRMQVRSYEERENGAAQDIMVKSSRILDTMIIQTREAATALIKNEEVIGAAVAPNHENKERSYAILRQLQETAGGSSLIRKAVLYIAYDKSEYTSELKEQPAAEDSELELLYQAFREEKSTSVSSPVLFSNGGISCIALDFPIRLKRSLATVFLYLNKDYLYAQVKDSEDSGEILILDSSGDIFLAPAELTSEARERAAAWKEGDREKETLSYTSARTGLTVLYLAYPQKTMLQRMMPLLLILLLLLAFATVYALSASAYAYRPIRTLVDTVDSASAESFGASGAESEFDYLKRLFGQMHEENTSLATTAAMLIPEAERRLLTELIRNPEAAPRVRSDLERIHSDLVRDRAFHVTAVRLSTVAGADVSPALMRKWIDQVRERLPGDPARFAVETGEGSAVMIAALRREDAGSVTAEAVCMADAVSAAEAASASNLLIATSAGSVTYRIEDALEEYRRELEKLPRPEPDRSSSENEMTQMVLMKLEQSTMSSKTSTQICRAVRYIEEAFGNGMLSLGDVAEQVGISASGLSTLFTTELGIHFSEFLNRYRIEEAKRMLLESDKPAREIYSLCGFNSVQNFNRVFKQYAEMTPGEYRKVIGAR